jgi:citrate synthase
MATSLSQGMEDVVAAESAITWIDGKTGQLRYRGYPIGELADRCTFEQVVYLLWHGEIPTETQLEDLRQSLRAFRMEYGSLLGLIKTVPHTAHPLDVLRFCVSRDALDNPLTADNSVEANWIKSMQFIAWFPLVSAGFHRLRQGKVPVPPHPDLDTAANFLYMLRGSDPDEVAVRTLDTSLVLHADHELNASTFAARVTIATQSNLHAAIASALGTLAGPRHGGASDRVIHMLEEIGSPDRAESWALEQLAERRRIMGFGHRVYRTVDPRSRHLRVMAERLLADTDHAAWSDILKQLAIVMERERGLYPNVDLYAAVVNHELGIDPAFYTSIFACSRVAGWTAHAVEQLDVRMIRPVADYVGPGPRSLAAEAVV